MSSLGRLARSQDGRITLVFLLVVVVQVILVPRFTESAGNVFVRAAADGLVALGLMTVILQAELDLSVGSTLALAGTLTAGLANDIGYPLAVAVAVAAGAAVGMVNGLIVTRAHVNSFIGTLGMLVAVRGLAFVYSGGLPISGPSLDVAVAFSSPFIWEFTPRVLVLLAVAALLGLFLARARIGRDLYAVGGNREAAAAAGIPVERRIWLGFIISGVCAALAGALVAIELNTGSPVLGVQTVLIAITAIVIGGTSLTGGRGSAYGTLIGILILAALAVGLNLARVPSSLQQVITGAILVAVVLVDQVRARPRWFQSLVARGGS